MSVLDIIDAVVLGGYLLVAAWAFGKDYGYRHGWSDGNRAAQRQRAKPHDGLVFGYYATTMFGDRGENESGLYTVIGDDGATVEPK